MPDKSWKVHERAVATHFGTTREKRGEDFSVSNCDVLVNIKDWYEFRKYRETSKYSHIVVECKYSANLKLHQWMRDFSTGIPKSKIPVLFWDSPENSIPEYGVCWQKDFDNIWLSWMHDPHYSMGLFTSCWTIGYIRRKAPKYLDDWWNQSYGYCCELQKPPEDRNTTFRDLGERVLRQECNVYPLISVRAKKLKGRLMVWKLWWQPPEW